MGHEGTIRRGTRISGWTLILLLACASLAMAQDGNDGESQQTQLQTRQRAEIHNEGEEALQQRLQQRFQQRINAMENCDEATREQMRLNLHTCLQIGLQEEELAVLFESGEGSTQLQAKTLLRLQSHVMAAAAGDLPPEPLMAKVREGRLKGVSDSQLLQVIDRIGENLELAQQVTNRVRQMGPGEEGSPVQNRETIRTMARVLMQGVNERDCDQLMTRARDRLRDGSCVVDDYVSAAETVAQLVAKGVQRQRALDSMGDALSLGYQAEDLRRIRLMFLADGGENLDGPMTTLEGCLGDGMGPLEMQNQWRHTWQYMWHSGEYSGEGTGASGNHGGDVGGGPGGQGGGGNDDDNTGGHDDHGAGHGGGN